MVRTKFDWNKHAYLNFPTEEKENVRVGKTEAYPGRRTSLEAEYRASGLTESKETAKEPPKELSQVKCPYRIRRLSDFDEINTRNYDMVVQRAETTL